MSQVKLSDSDQNANIRHEKRDGEMYIALGIFIVALALPVLLGTFFAGPDNVRAAVVNVVCGSVLLLIGAGSIVYGYVLLERNKRRA